MDKRRKSIPNYLVDQENLKQKNESRNKEFDEMKTNLKGLNDTMASLKEEMKEKDEARDRRMDEISDSLTGLVDNMADLKCNLTAKYGKRT